MNQALVPINQWLEPTLKVAEGDQTIIFTIQDAFNYHGYDAVGGVVLGFRLLQQVAKLLVVEGELLQRRNLSLFTAFPGLGARDCFELITRMATEQRMRVDVNYANTIAQKAIQGHFYFCFSYQGKQIELAPIEGYPGEHFLTIGAASKQPKVTTETLKQWQQAKYDLANTLLTNRAQDVIRIV